ncbi:RNA polymerase sigma factor [Pseudonocardia nigra]|uniref:RNA polymerase sigma factor n=1 Tax=Pseudonocardia nigra TaxID=1921578 RepID=UPI001C5F1375|nr:sigma factor-like helix-turn-helix DNA-binding protein [Pseudonocardia nigra]
MSAPVDQRANADEIPAAESGNTRIVQDDPTPTPAQLRVDFGAHLEANYQRLVAQLYAITLDPGEAHDVVQDAYSRAWRNWAEVGRSPDPSAWIRRVAVRSTIRSWRRLFARLGIGRPRTIGAGVDPRTGALLAALGRLPAAERRAVVLSHMAGVSLAEIAAVEQVTVGTVQARLSRARNVVTEGMADALPAVLGVAVDDGYDDDYEVGAHDADEDGADGHAAEGHDVEGYGVDAHDDEGENR